MYIHIYLCIERWKTVYLPPNKSSLGSFHVIYPIRSMVKPECVSFFVQLSAVLFYLCIEV